MPPSRINTYEDAFDMVEEADPSHIVDALEHSRPDLAARVKEFSKNLINEEDDSKDTLLVSVARHLEWRRSRLVRCEHCKGVGSVSGIGECAVCCGAKVVAERDVCRCHR